MIKQFIKNFLSGHLREQIRDRARPDLPVIINRCAENNDKLSECESYKLILNYPKEFSFLDFKQRFPYDYLWEMEKFGRSFLAEKQRKGEEAVFFTRNLFRFEAENDAFSLSVYQCPLTGIEMEMTEIKGSGSVKVEFEIHYIP